MIMGESAIFSHHLIIKLRMKIINKFNKCNGYESLNLLNSMDTWHVQTHQDTYMTVGFCFLLFIIIIIILLIYTIFSLVV